MSDVLGDFLSGRLIPGPQGPPGPIGPMGMPDVRWMPVEARVRDLEQALETLTEMVSKLADDNKRMRAILACEHSDELA